VLGLYSASLEGSPPAEATAVGLASKCSVCMCVRVVYKQNKNRRRSVLMTLAPATRAETYKAVQLALHCIARLASTTGDTDISTIAISQHHAIQLESVRVQRVHS
jgi:hypothetical protein